MSGFGMADMSKSDLLRHLRTLLHDAAGIELVASLAFERTQKQKLTGTFMRWNVHGTTELHKFNKCCIHDIGKIWLPRRLRRKFRRVQASVPLSANDFQSLC